MTFKCLICLQRICHDIDNVKLFKLQCCKNIYHFDCIMQWFNDGFHRSCPSCLTHLNKYNIQLIIYNFEDEKYVKFNSGNLQYNNNMVVYNISYDDIYDQSNILKPTDFIKQSINYDYCPNNKLYWCFICFCIWGISIFLFLLPGFFNGTFT